MLVQEEYELTDDQSSALEAFMKRKRLEAGYPRQSDAAVAIGVSQDLISRLESRFTPNIRIGEFGRVLRAYKIPPNEAYEILGLYEPPEPLSPKENWFLRRDLLPYLLQLDEAKLKVVKRVVEGLLEK